MWRDLDRNFRRGIRVELSVIPSLHGYPYGWTFESSNGMSDSMRLSMLPRIFRQGLATQTMLVCSMDIHGSTNILADIRPDEAWTRLPE